MKSIPRCVAAVSASLLLLGSSLSAANSVVAEPGLIGKPRAGVDFTYADHTGTRYNRAPGASAEFNVPLAPKYDLSFAYDYSRASGDEQRISGSALAATLLTYNRTEHGKAYFSGSIGHAWDRVRIRETSSRENGMIWAVRAGYEVPMGARTAVNAGLGYREAFDDGVARNPTVDFRVEANHWFNSNLAGVISGAYHQVRRAPDAIVYTVGLRWLY